MTVSVKNRQIMYHSFFRSLRQVQPTLDPSAETSVLAHGEEGNW